MPLAAHEAVEEDAYRALVDDSQALFLQFGDDAGQHIVVEGLAAFGGGHAEPGEEGIGVFPRGVHEGLPNGAGGGVAPLEVDHRPAGGVSEVGVGIEALLGLLVEGLEVGDANGVGVPQGLGLRLPQVLNQHAERGAPVADMIEAEDVVASEFEDAANGVADDRGTHVTRVHFLGEIRAGEVEGDLLGVSSRGDSKTGIRLNRLQGGSQEFVLQAEVNEARSRNLQRLHNLRRAQVVDDHLGDLAGLLLEALAQPHGGVGLVVPELLVLGGTDQGVGIGRLGHGSGDGGPDQVGDLFDDRLHAGVWLQLRYNINRDS